MSRFTWIALLLTSAACGSGESPGTPLGGTSVIPEMLVCRSRVNNPMNFSEIALRTAQNLGTSRISDRAGIERRVRLHPNDNILVFARERAGSDPDSRELFTSTVDGSESELRLTQNSQLDDEPCWSPTGDAILYTSERAGPRSLWLCDPDGRNPRQFLTPTTGSTDGQADWCAATDRIVFSRRDPNGRHTLWLVQGDGTGLTPFTDGGTAIGADGGDHEPAFSPDGNTVVFARRAGNGAQTGSASLCIAEIASGTVTERLLTPGNVGQPRYTPMADRIFFGLAEPEAGRAPLRLAFVPVETGPPVLVWPDERYGLLGIAFLPTMPELAAGLLPTLLDVEEAELEIAWGSFAFGNQSQLVAEDGNEFVLQTRTTSNRETAGIGLHFALPVVDPLDVLEVRVVVTCRVTELDNDTALRISLYNPVEGRFDTVVDLEPPSTAAQQLTFSTSSLRHVSREGQIRFNVIGELGRDNPAELRVDFVQVTIVEVATTLE